VNHAASTNETEYSRLPKYLRANLPPQRESLGGQFRRLLGGNCTLSVPPLAVHCPWSIRRSRRDFLTCPCVLARRNSLALRYTARWSACGLGRIA